MSTSAPTERVYRVSRTQEFLVAAASIEDAIDMADDEASFNGGEWDAIELPDPDDGGADILRRPSDG